MLDIYLYIYIFFLFFSNFELFPKFSENDLKMNFIDFDLMLVVVVVVVVVALRNGLSVDWERRW